MRRRDLLRLAAAGGATAALAGCTAARPGAASTPSAGPSSSSSSSGGTPVPPAPSLDLTSRPDLHPPVVTSTTGADPASVLGDLRLFLGPKDVGAGASMQGELVLDAHAQPLYVHDAAVATFGVRPQRYRGVPVLTYWSGSSSSYGHGDVVLLDDRYREVRRVTTAGDVGTHQADMHESLLTDRGTVLLTSYPLRQADLSDVGGPSDGWMLDGVVQEVHVASGRLLLEWRASDHVPVSDTYQQWKSGQGTREQPFDTYHLNSVEPDGDDHLLVSARHTHTVYRVERTSGRVAWRLGGRRSSFTAGADASFAWQHDARRQRDGSITVFDNEAAPTSSRGLRLAVDEDAMTTRVVAQYRPPRPRQSETQGNVQVLDDGRVVVGWGSQPYASVFTGRGDLLLDLSFGKGTSYRAFAGSWTGRPSTSPDAVLAPGGDAVAVSWNGSGEVARWRVRSGSSASTSRTLVTVDRAGFETSIRTPGLGAWTRVEALDRDGGVLGSTTLAA